VRLLLVPLGLLAFGFTLMNTVGSGVEVPESMEEVAPWLRGFGSWAWLAAGGVITADSILPMPSAPAMFSLGVIYGPLLGGLVGSLASLLAGLIGFGIVRFMGPRGVRWLVGDADLARAETFYDRHGLVAVALGKAVGGPAEWVVILAGLSRMPTGRVVMAIALGAVPAGFVMAALGALAIDRPWLALVLTVTVAAAVVFLGPRVLGIGRPADGP
jgi:uncharacterized membrane protein YdjX (TVP38/TMEM64 family)